MVLKFKCSNIFDYKLLFEEAQLESSPVPMTTTFLLSSSFLYFSCSLIFSLSLSLYICFVVLCGYPPKELSYYDDNCCLKDTGIKTGENIIVEELDEPYHKHCSEKSDQEKRQRFASSGSSQGTPDIGDVVFVREEKQASIEVGSTRSLVTRAPSNGRIMRKSVK